MQNIRIEPLKKTYPPKIATRLQASTNRVVLEAVPKCLFFTGIHSSRRPLTLPELHQQDNGIVVKQNGLERDQDRSGVANFGTAS